MRGCPNITPILIKGCLCPPQIIGQSFLFTSPRPRSTLTNNAIIAHSHHSVNRYILKKIICRVSRYYSAVMLVPVLEPSPLAGEGGTRSVTDEGEEGTKTPPAVAGGHQECLFLKLSHYKKIFWAAF